MSTIGSIANIQCLNTLQQPVRLCARLRRDLCAAEYPRDLFLPPGVADLKE